MVLKCYNGCPNNELKAIWDDRDSAIREGRERGIGITYFPVEQAWQAYCLKDYSQLSEFCSTARAALNEALKHG